MYVYVLKSAGDGKMYTGSAENLRERLKLHSKGRVKSTKNRGPFSLIYYEWCRDASDGRSREKYLKSGMGKRFLRNRLKRSLSLT